MSTSRRLLLFLLMSLTTLMVFGQQPTKVVDISFLPLSLLNQNQRSLEFGLSYYPIQSIEIHGSAGIGFIQNKPFGFQNYYKTRGQVLYRLPFIKADYKILSLGFEYSYANGDATRYHNYVSLNNLSYRFDEAYHKRQVTTYSAIASFTFDWPKFAISFTLGYGTRQTTQSLSDFVNLREEQVPDRHGPIFTLADRNLSDAYYEDEHVVAQIAFRFPLIKRKNPE